MATSMRALAAVCVLLALVGCAERKAHLAVSEGEVRLATAPKPSHALAIRFGDRVELIGYDLSRPEPAPGQELTITWYWKVLSPLDAGFQVFTHVADAAGRTLMNLDSARSMRSAYPEARWRAGDFIRDAQAVTLPADWASAEARFFLGFYRDAQRLPISAGPHDSDRRAEALRLRVARAPGVKGEPALPELTARRARGTVTLDGKLDEPDWQSAPDTGPFVNTMSGGSGSFPAHARLLYDDAQLYAAFFVEDSELRSTFQRDDDHLWEQDTIEIMLDPEGDARNYFELQVSPRGKHFDTRYDSPRQPRPFGHVDWDSRVKAGVQLDGTLDDDAVDTGYQVELAIPWAALDVAAPKPGDVWRINLFVMNSQRGGQRAVGWSAPRVGDFHTLSRFGKVRFE